MSEEEQSEEEFEEDRENGIHIPPGSHFKTPRFLSVDGRDLIGLKMASHSKVLTNGLFTTLAVPESRFDHDTEESGEEMEEDEEDETGEGDVTPQSQTHSRSVTPEENYIPDSPPISPVELKKELPKYLPALQVCLSISSSFFGRQHSGPFGSVE